MTLEEAAIAAAREATEASAAAHAASVALENAIEGEKAAKEEVRQCIAALERAIAHQAEANQTLERANERFEARTREAAQLEEEERNAKDDSFIFPAERKRKPEPEVPKVVGRTWAPEQIEAIQKFARVTAMKELQAPFSQLLAHKLSELGVAPELHVAALQTLDQCKQHVIDGLFGGDGTPLKSRPDGNVAALERLVAALERRTPADTRPSHGPSPEQSSTSDHRNALFPSWWTHEMLPSAWGNMQLLGPTLKPAAANTSSNTVYKTPAECDEEPILRYVARGGGSEWVELPASAEVPRRHMSSPRALPKRRLYTADTQRTVDPKASLPFGCQFSGGADGSCRTTSVGTPVERELSASAVLPALPCSTRHLTSAGGRFGVPSPSRAAYSPRSSTTACKSAPTKLSLPSVSVNDAPDKVSDEQTPQRKIPLTHLYGSDPWH